jgi:hypothetical protein
VAVLDGRSEIRWPRLWHHPLATVVSLVPIALAFVVARYPGERVDQHISHARWIPPNIVTAWLGARDSSNAPIATSVHDLLFNGGVDEVTRHRKSFFSNTLVLPEFDGPRAAGIDDPKKLDGDNIKHTLVLRGRHLKGAVLTHADLRKADLEAAKLERAVLVGARLDNANLQNASLRDARLRGASLEGTRLQDADLGGTELEGTRRE